MKKKKERIITFEEQLHKEYLNDVFNMVLVIGCFICVSQALFSVPVPLLFHNGRRGDFLISLKIFLDFLYKGVALYAPFLIYNIIKHKTPGKFFLTEKSSASPLYYILGIPSVVGVGVSVQYLSTFIVSAMRANKYIINEEIPETGDSLATNIVFIVLAFIIPAFFQEITFRGIVISDMKKDSFVFSVIISSMLMSFSHISIQKIIYMFISGLILGWLYLKTSSLWLTFVCSGCLNGMLAVLWIFRVNNESVYLEMIPKIALIAGIVGILCALCMFFIFGFKIERTETGLKRGEAVKAFFKSFALWIFIFITVFRFFFLYINRPNDEEDNYGKEPAESEPADETTASFKTADIYIINNLSFI